MTACWGREQWFSSERISGVSAATKAASRMPSIADRKEILDVSVWPW